MKNYKNTSENTNTFEDFEGLQVEGMLDFIKPEIAIKPLTAKGLSKIQKRGISEKVIADYRIGTNEAGEFVFPFFENMNDEEPVRVKIKPIGDKLIRRHTDGSPKELFEETVVGGKEILFGSHLYEKYADSVAVLTFGEADALTAAECGFWGLSAPEGFNSDGFCQTQRDFLDKLPKIVIAPSVSKEAHTALIERNKLINLVKKLGAGRISVVKNEAMRGCRNLNELLYKFGKDAVESAVNAAGIVEDTTVYSIADVKIENDALDGTLCGWSKIDEMLGGFRAGGLTIIGGNTENGKTTTVLNLIAALISRVNCWYWTGEETDKEVLFGMRRVLAGPLGLYEKKFESGKSFHLLKEKYEAAITEYLRKRLFLFDDSKLEKKPDAATYFRKAAYAIQRFGCKMIIFDNLMAFTGGTGAAYLQAQADFAEECKRFAKRHNVHVFLVAHNRKLSSYEITQTERGKTAPGVDDIEGSSKITNWADNVLQIWRVSYKVKLVKEELAETDTVINLCKNRGSKKKKEVRFKYCIASRRIYEQDNPPSQYRLFGWEPEELRREIAEKVKSVPASSDDEIIFPVKTGFSASPVSSTNPFSDEADFLPANEKSFSEMNLFEMDIESSLP